MIPTACAAAFAAVVGALDCCEAAADVGELPDESATLGDVLDAALVTVLLADGASVSEESASEALASPAPDQVMTVINATDTATRTRRERLVAVAFRTC